MKMEAIERSWKLYKDTMSKRRGELAGLVKLLLTTGDIQMTKKNPLEMALKAPLAIDEIEWRVSRSGQTSKGAWAMVLAYTTSRGVMNRLDSVFGVDGWRDEYQFLPDGVVCTLSCKVGDVWISKQDGAPQTNVESFKGGISDALKRAAVKWGIGRYLYNLDETFVEIQANKPSVDRALIHRINDKKNNIKGFWVTPNLPKWAQPQA